jgi:uncharacterized protein
VRLGGRWCALGALASSLGVLGSALPVTVGPLPVALPRPAPGPEVVLRTPIRPVPRVTAKPAPVPPPAPPRSRVVSAPTQRGCPPHRGTRPVAGAATRPARNASPGYPLELVIAGDSMPGYVATQVIGRGDDRGRLRACVDTRHSTGLSRPDYWNWGIYAHRLMDRRDPEAVVFMIGGNDCQNLWQPDGRLARVGTKEWILEYRRRARQMYTTFADGGRRRVYWVGMPIARRADLAGCYRSLNGAVLAASRDVPGARFLDIWPTFAPGGKYADVLPDEQGRPILARAGDGIHLTFPGSQLVARQVLAALEDDLRLTR